MQSDRIAMRDMIRLNAVLSAFLISTALALTAVCPAGSADNDQLASHLSISSATTNRTINISGEIVDTEGWRIVDDFIVIAVNNVTSEKTTPKYSDRGAFTIQIQVPAFAEDNQSVEIRILSTDQLTLYANTTLRLNNTNHTSSFYVKMIVANPPPNYNWLIIVLLLIVFSCILASYILFTKWLVAQAVLRRANEIMIKRYSSGNEEIQEGKEDSDDGSEQK